MKDLVINHKFDLTSNIQDVKSSIDADLNKYRSLIVGEDDIKVAKTLMADINKQKKSFKDKVKEFLSVIETPLKEFKTETKAIENLYDEARETLKGQVETYEAQRLKEINIILAEYVRELCYINEIDTDTIQFQDLVKLTAVTTTNKVAKATKDALDNRVNAILIEKQKAQLEEQKRQEEIRIKAEELARQKEIEAIKRAEAEKQQALRDAELQKERELKEAHERAEREKQQALKEADEQKQKELEAQRVKPVFVANDMPTEPLNTKATIDDTCYGNYAVDEPLHPTQLQNITVAPLETSVPEGKKVIELQALFQIVVSENLSPELVANKLIERLKEDANITSLKSVSY